MCEEQSTNWEIDMQENSQEARLIAAMRNMSESDRQFLEELAVRLASREKPDLRQREEASLHRHC